MNNLFSIFDPISGTFNLPLNWLSTFLLIVALPSQFWLIPSQLIVVFKSIFNYVHNEFTAILGARVPGLTWVRTSLFSFIMFNNALGLVPYIFTSSRHLRFTLALSLPLWLGHYLVSWAVQPVSMLAHLVPLGTPYPLMPFMVLIELVRGVIRPGTLAVRLAANMVAGHLLLTLIGSLAPSLSAPLLVCLLGGLIALIILESAVALIQSYVFRVLITLYVEEVNSKKIST